MGFTVASAEQLVLTTMATFYRLMWSNPPTTDDFQTNGERGRRYRQERGESVEDWTGLSVFDSLEAVSDLLQRVQFGARARWVAQLDVPEPSATE